MRFAGDLFKAFSQGGVAGATGAYDPMKGVFGTIATSDKPWSKGLGGLTGYLASGDADDTADSGGFGLGGFAAKRPFVGGLAGSFGGDQAESRSPFPIGGLVGGLFG